MAESFATADDLMSFYPLDSSERQRAQTEQVEPGICKDIVIAMVQRFFEQERNTAVPDGVTSTTMSVDGFSQSFGFGQPVGGLRLLPRELKLLGQGKQHIGHIEL